MTSSNSNGDSNGKLNGDTTDSKRHSDGDSNQDHASNSDGDSTKHVAGSLSNRLTKTAFSKSVEIRFSECDPAGIMFFGNIYHHAHDFYEDFVRHLGFEWRDWFENNDWMVPLRHSSAEHLLPIRPGAVYQMQVMIERIGESSFTGKYWMTSSLGTHAEVTLVHTFVSAKTKEKTSIPLDVRRRLEAYQLKCLHP